VCLELLRSHSLPDKTLRSAFPENPSSCLPLATPTLQRADHRHGVEVGGEAVNLPFSDKRDVSFLAKGT